MKLFHSLRRLFIFSKNNDTDEAVSMQTSIITGHRRGVIKKAVVVSNDQYAEYKRLLQYAGRAEADKYVAEIAVGKQHKNVDGITLYFTKWPLYTADEYVSLAANQVAALQSMQASASKQQVCELLDLYESTNRGHQPKNPVFVCRKDILSGHKIQAIHHSELSRA